MSTLSFCWEPEPASWEQGVPQKGYLWAKTSNSYTLIHVSLVLAPCPSSPWLITAAVSRYESYLLKPCLEVTDWSLWKSYRPPLMGTRIKPGVGLTHRLWFGNSEVGPRFCISSKPQLVLMLLVQGPHCIAGVQKQQCGLDQNHLSRACLKCRLLGCTSVLWD